MITFKTTINCGGCVAKVSPFLNTTAGEGNWSIDTANPAKILTVTNEAVLAADVKTGLEKLGYTAEPL